MTNPSELGVISRKETTFIGGGILMAIQKFIIVSFRQMEMSDDVCLCGHKFRLNLAWEHPE